MSHLDLTDSSNAALAGCSGGAPRYMDLPPPRIWVLGGAPHHMDDLLGVSEGAPPDTDCPQGVFGGAPPDKECPPRSTDAAKQLQTIVEGQKAII